jgi:hypothetical protein
VANPGHDLIVAQNKRECVRVGILISERSKALFYVGQHDYVHLLFPPFLAGVILTEGNNTGDRNTFVIVVFL